jgi:hypothetical protein
MYVTLNCTESDYDLKSAKCPSGSMAYLQCDGIKASRVSPIQLLRRPRCYKRTPEPRVASAPYTRH